MTDGSFNQDEQRALDHISTEFEAELQAGKTPRLEQYLAKVHSRMQPAVFKALIKIEARFLSNTNFENYRERFPQFESEIREICEESIQTEAPEGDLDGTKSLREADRAYEPSTQLDNERGTVQSHLERYRILRILGRGAFGVVYLAHDTELDRLVALKVPHPERLKREVDVETYRSEARTMAQLDHANIVPVYDVGSSKGYPCYIVTKYIEGTDLLGAGQLNIRDSVQLIAKVAEALAYAHSFKIVHRDVKPSNILIDQDGKPYLADFGLALDQSSDSEFSGFAGSPSYMSPEQAVGESSLDGRSDTFSLGVVFYELLTQKRPFTGRNLTEVTNSILDDAPTIPSQVNGSVPPELDRILLKMLAKSRSERYQFATDLSSDLGEWLSNQSSLSPGTSRPHPHARHFDDILGTGIEFIGREEVIRSIGQFLLERDHGALIIEGEPGRGKSAIMIHLINHVFRKQSIPPVYFFYQQTAGYTSPDLCAQVISEQLVNNHGIESEPLLLDSARYQFGLILDQVGQRIKPPASQIIVIDALDESIAPTEGRTPLDFVPSSIPQGVFLIASRRPAADVSGLNRNLDVVFLNLDAPDLLQENLNSAAEYAHGMLSSTSLPDGTAKRISGLGGGNFLVVKLVCEQLLRNPDDIEELNRFGGIARVDEQLSYIYEEFWVRITRQCSRDDVNLLGDVCAVLIFSHGPITSDLICKVLMIRSGDLDFALRKLSEVITAVQVDPNDSNQSAYRIYHQSFADYLRTKVSSEEERIRKRLYELCMDWRTYSASPTLDYALRFATHHAVEANEDPSNLLLSIDYLEAKTQKLGIFDLCDELSYARQHINSRLATYKKLKLTEEIVRRNVQFLDRHPEALFQVLWNTCWWYDSPGGEAHYDNTVQPEVIEDSASPLRLFELLESWRELRARTVQTHWLRSLRPPREPPGSSLEAVYRGHRSSIVGIASLSENNDIVSASSDGTIRCWDLESGKAELIYEECELLYPKLVVVAPSGEWMLTADDQLTITVLSRDGVILHRLPAADYRTTPSTSENPTETRTKPGSAAGARMAIPASSEWFASGGAGDEVVLWSTRDWSPTVRLRQPTRVMSLAIGPDSRTMAVGCSSGLIQMWDAEKHQKTKSLKATDSPITSLCFHSDLRILFAGTMSGKLFAWHYDTAVVYQIDAHQNTVNRICLSPDGTVIASCSHDKTIRLSHVSNGAEIRRLRGHDHWVTGLEFLNDGNRIVSGSVDSTIRVWDLAITGHCKTLIGHQSAIGCIAPSPQGNVVATGGDDTVVIVWDCESGLALHYLEGHSGPIRALTWSSDGSKLASGAEDGTVRTWDAQDDFETCTEFNVPRLRMYEESWVMSVDFSPDAKRIAAGTDEGLILVWEMDFYIPICLEGHQGNITSLRFDVCGEQLTSRSADGTMRKWNISSETCLEERIVESDELEENQLGDQSKWAATTVDYVLMVQNGESETERVWYPEHMQRISQCSNKVWAGSRGSDFFLLKLVTDGTET